jgi:ankyrin repeat protein
MAGISPLHAAAYVQNEEMTALLLNQGALWNAGRHNTFKLRCEINIYGSGSPSKYCG